MTDKHVKAVVADLANLEYEGNLSAVGFCAILANGDMRVNFVAPDGTKQALYTAAAILNRDLLSHFEVIKKGRET